MINFFNPSWANPELIFRFLLNKINQSDVLRCHGKSLFKWDAAAIEREVSRTLADFLNEFPSAQSIFRTSFYGQNRDMVNMTLVTALQNIPTNRRAMITKEILLEILSNKYSGHREFVQQMIESSLELNPGPELFKLPTYLYNDLLTIIKTAKSKGYPVLVFREGKGEFALLQDPARKTTYYYYLDNQRREGVPISESAFNLALEWRQRSIPQIKGGWSRTVVLNMIGFGSGSGTSTIQLDQVQAYEQNLQHNRKLIWRYTMNSLSDESYALVLHLLKNGVTHLESVLDPSEVGFHSRNLRNFVQAIWQEARRIGYSVQLNKDVYAVPELDEILRYFKIEAVSSDCGDTGYRVVNFENEKLYFIMERTADNQVVFRKKSEAEFKALQRQENAMIDEAFQRYTPVPEITLNVDAEHFPEQIIPIPHNYLADLNVALNPGHASMGGFKQPNENLSDLIRTDAETVTRLGYTHKSLAEWLFKIMKLAENKQLIVNLNGRSYEVVVMETGGFQYSPFGDNIKWKKNYTVMDMKTGKRIQFSGGHPYMIGYYGFFEGNVPYRVPPAELIDLIEGQ